MANLFLDTEIRWLLPQVALELRASGLPKARLTAMWKHDVTPVLHWNLKNPAGEWALFDREWLVRSIRRRRSRRWLRLPGLGELAYRSRIWPTHAVWPATLVLWHRLGDLPADEHEPRTKAWEGLSRIYLERPNEGPITDLADHLLRASCYPAEELERIAGEEIGPLLEPMLRVRWGDPEPEQARLNLARRFDSRAAAR